VRLVSIAKSGTRHVTIAIGEAVLLLAISVALIIGTAVLSGTSPIGTGTALAGKSMSLVIPDGEFGGSTTARLSGDSASLAATASGSMWLRAICQLDADGSTGLVAWERLDASGQASIALGPTPSWGRGSASCTAAAGTFDSHTRFKVAVTTTFYVSG
jgi:hypothetical protein